MAQCVRWTVVGDGRHHDLARAAFSSTSAVASYRLYPLRSDVEAAALLDGEAMTACDIEWLRWALRRAVLARGNLWIASTERRW